MQYLSEIRLESVSLKSDNKMDCVLLTEICKQKFQQLTNYLCDGVRCGQLFFIFPTYDPRVVRE